MAEPPIQLSEGSMRPASRRACLDFWRSPWRSPMAMRRSGDGYVVCNAGLGLGLGFGGKKRPLTVKSTKVSMKEERR